MKTIEPTRSTMLESQIEMYGVAANTADADKPNELRQTFWSLTANTAVETAGDPAPIIEKVLPTSGFKSRFLVLDPDKPYEFKVPTTRDGSPLEEKYIYLQFPPKAMRKMGSGNPKVIVSPQKLTDKAVCEILTTMARTIIMELRAGKRKAVVMKEEDVLSKLQEA